MSKRKTEIGQTLATLRREHQERALVLAEWEEGIRNEEKEEKKDERHYAEMALIRFGVQKTVRVANSNKYTKEEIERIQCVSNYHSKFFA